ncbi:MAG: hypothetical protein QGH50_01875, partial [SAR324 cluster bacterium]|nr:hypothetical protein [SAR324 cluster bacterium]
MTYAKVGEKGERLIERILNKGDKEKFQIAQYFLKNHSNSRDGLKEIGVVRTNKLAHAEYAEWFRLVLQWEWVLLGGCLELVGFGMSEDSTSDEQDVGKKKYEVT